MAVTETFDQIPCPNTDPAGAEAPRPEAPRRGGVSAAALVTWAVIVALVVFLILIQRDQQQLAAEATPAGDIQRFNLALEFLSRYAVGVGRFFDATAPPGVATGPAPQGDPVAVFVQQLDAAAQSPIDRLRIVPVMAELQDVDAALSRLVVLQAAPELDDALRQDVAALTTIYETGAQALDEAQRRRLRQRHRWPARLALSHGLAASDPARRQALAPTTRVLIVLVLGLMVAGVSGLTGLGLGIAAIVLVAVGRLRPHHQVGRAVPPGPGRTALLETVAVFLAGYIVLSFAFGALSQVAGVDLSWVVLWLLPLAMFWPLLRGVTWAELRQAWGWHRGRGVAFEAVCGVAGQLAGLPLLVIGIIVTLIIVVVSQQDSAAPMHPLFEQLSQAGWWAVVRLYLLACVWAPLVEETVFRGAFYHHVRRRCGVVISAVAVGFVFAAIHPQGLAAIPALLSRAVVFALLREWRGSLIAPITAHACNNAWAVTMALLLLGS